jgi:putative ABC transport system ATP-binding protein
MTAPVLSAEDLVRYRGDRSVIAGATLSLDAGESVALVGPSGCGKTTLLHMLGLLDRPASGTLLIGGVHPWRLNAAARAALRLQQIGFVFQQSNLLPFLSARDNVAVAAWRLGGDRRAALEAAEALLDRFGLADRANARGGVLSLGEAQRVAVARALINRPALVLADEPTGSLDSQAMNGVLVSFEEVVRQGTALVVATHDPRVAARMHRVVRVDEGKLVDEAKLQGVPSGGVGESPESAELRAQEALHVR